MSGRMVGAVRSIRPEGVVTLTLWLSACRGTLACGSGVGIFGNCGCLMQSFDWLLTHTRIIFLFDNLARQLL